MSLKKPQETTNLNDFIAQQREKSCFAGLPLEGKRVIYLSSVIAAPYCAALLGDAGAEIIKVENPMAPDALRGWGTHAATVPNQLVFPYAVSPVCGKGFGVPDIVA